MCVAVLHPPAALRHLQIVEQRLQLAQQLPGGVAVAEPRQILDAVEHPVEVALAQHPAVHIRHHLRQIVALAGHLFGETLQELLHGLTQFLCQPGDLFIARTVFKRLLQCFAGGVQPFLGVR